MQHLKQIDMDEFDEIVDNEVFGYEINDKGMRSDLSVWCDGTMINTTFGIVFDKNDKIISNLSVGSMHELMENWHEIKLMQSYDFDCIYCGCGSANPVVSTALNYAGNGASLVNVSRNDNIYMENKYHQVKQKVDMAM